MSAEAGDPRPMLALAARAEWERAQVAYEACLALLRAARLVRLDSLLSGSLEQQEGAQRNVSEAGRAACLAKAAADEAYFLAYVAAHPAVTS